MADRAIIDALIEDCRVKRQVVEKAYLAVGSNPSSDDLRCCLDAMREYITTQDALIARIVYPSRGLVAVK